MLTKVWNVPLIVKLPFYKAKQSGIMLNIRRQSLFTLSGIVSTNNAFQHSGIAR